MNAKAPSYEVTEWGISSVQWLHEHKNELMAAALDSTFSSSRDVIKAAQQWDQSLEIYRRYKLSYTLLCYKNVIKVNKKMLTNALSISQRRKSRQRKTAGLTPGSNCTIFDLYIKLCEIKVRMLNVLLGTLVLFIIFVSESSILN